jgi:hypothetical protein
MAEGVRHGLDAGLVGVQPDDLLYPPGRQPAVAACLEQVVVAGVGGDVGSQGHSTATIAATAGQRLPVRLSPR